MTNVKLYTPGLRYDVDWDRWVLTLSDEVTQDATYALVIDCAFRSEEEGWFGYRYVRWIDGDFIEIVTEAQYKERIADIRQNEGDEIAQIWVMEQEQVRVAPDHHPVFALRKHWEAMMALNLFMPAVTLRVWEGILLSQSILEKTNAVRERIMREESESMSAVELSKGPYIIWYMRPEFMRDGLMGTEWCRSRDLLSDDLSKTHIMLKMVPKGFNNLEQLYQLMQGENWSPNGEACSLIESLGLTYTSMSVGDIAVDVTSGGIFMVDTRGFTMIGVGHGLNAQSA